MSARGSVPVRVLVAKATNSLSQVSQSPAWSRTINPTGKCLFFVYLMHTCQLGHLKLVFLSCLCVSSVAHHPAFNKPGIREARTTAIWSTIALWGQDTTSVCPLKSSSIPMTLYYIIYIYIYILYIYIYIYIYIYNDIIYLLAVPLPMSGQKIFNCMDE